MAYRDLDFGDLVRIVSKDNPYHGRNAVVIDKHSYDEERYRVQVNTGGNSGPVAVFWLCENELIIRDEPAAFVIDGRVDHEAQRKHEYQESLTRARRSVEYTDDVVSFAPCGVCACCEAHQ